MIPKGLHVGDTYLEGSLVYKVTKVVSDDVYEGTWTGETSSKAPVADNSQKKVEKAEITSDDVNYVDMPYAQLKKLCAERGLDATGKKDDLVERLKG